MNRVRNVVVALLVALLLAATPAYANIVWATFADTYCENQEVFQQEVLNNYESFAWFLYENDQELYGQWSFVGTPELLWEIYEEALYYGASCG